VTALFSAGAFSAVELAKPDAARLQAFFEANPQYHLAVCGEPPAADEASKMFESSLPEGWRCRKEWTLGFAGSGGELAGMASVVAGLFCDEVWHLSLFIVATPLRGSGAAHALYRALEAWMRDGGAAWSRLGVVEGNLRAVRFWERAGYVDVRKRAGIELGQLTHVVRVMVKPLTAGSLTEYLAKVARDRPDAP
jgi:ribosomal protein S18 acetylase RimI-like enzyme